MIGLKRREEEIDILQKRLFRINYFRDIKYEISFKKLKDPLSIEIPIRFKSSEEYMRYFESYLYKKILWEIGRRIEEEMINEARRVIIVDGKLEKSGYLYLCIKIAVENEEREDVLAKKEEGDVDVDKDKDKEIDINTMNSINRDKDINKAVRTMDMHKDDLIILTKGEDPIAKDVHFVGIVEGINNIDNIHNINNIDNIDNINDIKVKTEISGKDHSGVLNALFKNSEWKVYKLFNMREYMEAFKSIRNIENSPLVNYIVNIVEMERDIPPIYYTVPSPSASHNTYQGCLRKVGVSLFDIENDEWEGGWGEQIVLLVDQLLTISTFANPKQPKVWSLDELMHDSDDDGYQDGYIYNIQNKRKICPWLFGDDAHMDNYPHLESLLSHPSPKYFKAIHTDFSLTLTKEKYEEKPPQNILICSSDTFQLDNLLLCFHQYRIYIIYIL